MGRVVSVDGQNIVIEIYDCKQDAYVQKRLEDAAWSEIKDLIFELAYHDVFAYENESEMLDYIADDVSKWTFGCDSSGNVSVYDTREAMAEDFRDFDKQYVFLFDEKRFVSQDERLERYWDAYRGSIWYLIDYGTGAGNDYADHLVEAKEIADEGASYTQRDITIYERESHKAVAIRRWYGVKYDPDEAEQEDPIEFGDSGFYADWEDIGD